MNQTDLSSPQPPVVSIIIPNWNTAAMLTRCLRSLEPEQSSAGPPRGRRQLEVIVVDDASRDRSQELVRSRFPWVRLLAHERNLGFAASCNDGAEAARGAWVLFLNSDAFIDSTQVHALVSIAEELGAAAVGPQLVYEDGELQDSGGMLPRPTAIARTKLGRVVHRELVGASHHRFIAGTVPCQWISGACLLVRADAFRSAGGFDTRFSYFEDVDLCERLRLSGGRLFLAGRIRVIHVGGQSFGLIAAQVPRHYRESQRLLAERYFSSTEKAILGATFAADAALRWLLAVRRRVQGDR